MGDMDVFGDPVHGAFQLSGIALQLSRTRQVQRLKRLKQLGLTCLVPRYSFATHTRWQHSLGVAHLAGVVGSSIAAAQPHLDVRSEDVEDLQLAGLFHDTGHGPFSHMFEQKIMPALGVPHWEHEAMSLQLLEAAVDEAGVDLDTNRIRRIQDMICGTDAGSLSPAGRAFAAAAGADDGMGDGCHGAAYSTGPWLPHKQWMRQVVSAPAVDVDRGDYLARDALHTHKQLSRGNYLDLFRGCRAVAVPGCPPVLSYASHHRPMVQEFLADRYRMYADVYTCTATQAIEVMVVDALVAAEPDLGIKQRACSVQEFLSLDDSLVDGITHLARAAGGSCSPGLRKASQIVQRLQAGNFYHCCAEVQLPAGTAASITAEGLATHASSSCPLQPAELAVVDSVVAMCRRGANPYNGISFHDECDVQTQDSNGSTSRGNGDCHWTTSNAPALEQPLLPEQRVVRVFYRSSSGDQPRPDVLSAVQSSLAHLLRLEAGLDAVTAGHTNPMVAHPSTPSKIR